MISVVGGTYLEYCLEPSWDEIYGSAGRAAVALSAITSDVTLHTVLDEKNTRIFSAIAKAHGISLNTRKSNQSIGFSYIHCLSTPVISPSKIERVENLKVDADIILRFGMMEATAVVSGKKVIYDPQSLFEPEKFNTNGSSADHLAVVVNRHELCKMTGRDDISSAVDSLLSDKTEVVVVKLGANGCLVCTSDSKYEVPAYTSSRVWSIGSGDIFSAAFTYFWGEKSLTAVVAADLASRSTSKYSETRATCLYVEDKLMDRAPISRMKANGKVYLAGPFFTLSQRWLIEESVSQLKSMGLDVFSPYHEIGPGPAKLIAKADLAGLESCDRLFACLGSLDSGTVFEIGYAVAKGIPVVVFAQNIAEEELKMIRGCDCQIYPDFVMALYNICWIKI